MDKKRRLMFCWNHKVASSFWLWVFLWLKEGREPKTSKLLMVCSIHYINLFMIGLRRAWSQLNRKYHLISKTYDEFAEVARSYENIILGNGILRMMNSGEMS